MKQPIAIDYTAALEQGGGIGRYVRELIHEMERILIEEAPVVLLFYDESIWLRSNHCAGLSVNALNHLDLRRCQLNAE